MINWHNGLYALKCQNIDYIILVYLHNWKSKNIIRVLSEERNLQISTMRIKNIIPDKNFLKSILI